MTKLKSTPRHPLHLLKGYRLFLEGAPDDEIIGTISEAETMQIKQFHSCLEKGSHFYHAGLQAKIEKYISKKLLIMYTEHKAGLPLSYSGKRDRETHPRLISTFTMLLDGASDTEMIENGSLESEIATVKNFLKYVSQDILITTLADKTSTMRATATKLKKIYNDKQSSLNEQMNTIVHPELIPA